MIFGCRFLGSFRPGYCQDPATCRTEKNLLLVMATGRVGKARAGFWVAVVAAAGLQRAWKHSTWLLGTFCLVVCILTPEQLSPALGSPHWGKEAGSVSSALDIPWWTGSQPDRHTSWAEPLAARSHLLSVDRAFSQIFTTTFWAVNIHIRK